MSKIGTLTLTGQSGNKYDFNVYAWGTDFNDFGAVYYVSKRTIKSDGIGSHTEIYVGETGDMSERFDNHHKAQCFKNNGANAISAHQDDDEDSRLQKETDLINALDPPCNG